MHLVVIKLYSLAGNLRALCSAPYLDPTVTLSSLIVTLDPSDYETSSVL